MPLCVVQRAIVDFDLVDARRRSMNDLFLSRDLPRGSRSDPLRFRPTRGIFHIHAGDGNGEVMRDKVFLVGYLNRDDTEMRFWKPVRSNHACSYLQYTFSGRSRMYPVANLIFAYRCSFLHWGSCAQKA